MDTEERLQELFLAGCPSCGQREEFLVEGSDLCEFSVLPPPVSGQRVRWGDENHLETQVDYFIHCPECDWRELLVEQLEKWLQEEQEWLQKAKEAE